MECTLSYIRYRLVTPVNFVCTLHQHILQVGYHCRFKSLWLGWCLHFFPFSSMQSTFLYQRCWNVGRSLHGGTSSTSVYSMSCVSIVFQQWILVIHLKRSDYNPVKSLDHLESPVRFLWPTILLNLTQYWNWKLHLTTIDVQLRLFIWYYLAVSFRFPLNM